MFERDKRNWKLDPQDPNAKRRFTHAAERDNTHLALPIDLIEELLPDEHRAPGRDTILGWGTPEMYLNNSRDTVLKLLAADECITVKNPSEIPKDYRPHVRNLILTSPESTDALAEFTGLKSLELRCSDISSSIIRPIWQLQQLLHLTITVDPELNQERTDLRVRIIETTPCSLDENEWRDIKNLKQLKSLHLSGIHHSGDNTDQWLRGLPQIEALSVDRCCFANNPSSQLQHLTQLRRFEVNQWSNFIQQEGMMKLTFLTKNPLTHLKLRGVHIGDEGVNAVVNQLKKLQELDLLAVGMTSASLNELTLPDLRYADFQHNRRWNGNHPFDRKTILEFIERHPHLDRLHIGISQYEDSPGFSGSLRSSILQNRPGLTIF